MTEKDTLKEALELFKLSSNCDSDNFERALDDLRFSRLAEQWPDEVISEREAARRPCLTFNKMPSFIRQVVNDGRLNKPAIKVHPADSQADVRTAEIINGLIRNIEYSSGADIAYDTGLDYAVSCGIGYWRVDMDYAHDDTFDMDIKIERMVNPFAVRRDHLSDSADSSDWNYCFVLTTITKDDFEKKYGDKAKIDWQSDEYVNMSNEWKEGENLVLAEYWRRVEVRENIHQLSDGRVVADEWLKSVVLGDLTNEQFLQASGITVVNSREKVTHKVTQYIMNGAAILEENPWAGKYIPIVPVYGEEISIEGKRYFRSLIHDAKDAQRNHNYWRTTATELVALAPKAPFIGAVGQFDTDADKWARANTDNLPYIEYDVVANAAPPQRQPFAGVPAGAMQEALNSADDMKAIIGIYDASLGARSNETSGRAINARQAQSDAATFHFIDNQTRAIKHTGRIILDLIPYVYNKARIVRVMGENKTPANVQINQDLGDGQIYDLTVGKYDLTIDVGASFQTKREEAAYGMTELVRAYPPSAAIIAPHLAKMQDWDGAEDIAQELQQLSPTNQNPQAQQLQQQLQQMQMQMQQMQQQAQEQIQQLQAKLQQEQMDKQLEALKLQVDKYNAETNRMKAIKEMPLNGAEVADDDISESERLQFEAEVKLRMEQIKIQGAKELELLKQSGIAQMQPDVTPEMSVNAQIEELKRYITAPRIMMRDENGRAIGSRIDLGVDQENGLGAAENGDIQQI